MMIRMHHFFFCLFVATTDILRPGRRGSCGFAEATLTISAADSSTGQIGASGTSCVPVSLYGAVYHAVPGRGLLVTQALPPPNNPPDDVSDVYAVGEAFLRNGTDPQVIVDVITDPSVDDATTNVDVGFSSDTVLRQYGIVDLEGRTAGYTGEGIDPFYDLVFDYGYEHVQEHTNGTVGDSIAYTAQGNIVSPNTVSILSDTFEAVNETCDLAGRLYSSLAAVFEADGQEGDVRCFDSYGSSGNSVFLHVDNADGTELVHIEKTDENDDGVGQWPAFKAEYAAWRAANPNPACDEVVIEEGVTASGVVSNRAYLLSTGQLLLLSLFWATMM